MDALVADWMPLKEIVAPLAERTAALLEALIQAEAVLRAHGFDPDTMPEKRGLPLINALADAIEALNQDAESRLRFEISAERVARGAQRDELVPASSPPKPRPTDSASQLTPAQDALARVHTAQTDERGRKVGPHGRSPWAVSSGSLAV